MTRAIRKHLGDFVALAALFAIGLAVTGYIVFQQSSRPFIPFIEKSPYKLKAQFSDAQAVVPGQGQTVRVAGVEVGKIAAVEGIWETTRGAPLLRGHASHAPTPFLPAPRLPSDLV